MKNQLGASVIAVRVGAQDVLATADFYKELFAFSEVNRLTVDDGRLEVILSAQTPGTMMIILQRESDSAVEEGMPHGIFQIGDMESSYNKAIAMGATIVHEPSIAEEMGLKAAILNDPAGNMFELIEQI